MQHKHHGQQAKIFAMCYGTEKDEFQNALKYQEELAANGFTKGQMQQIFQYQYKPEYKQYKTEQAIAMSKQGMNKDAIAKKLRYWEPKS